MSKKLRSKTAIKICGITTPGQARSIAKLDINAVGVIGVKHSPRYVKKEIREEIFDEVKCLSSNIDRVLVVANMTISDLSKTITCHSPPSVVQLHGNESPKFCKLIKSNFPSIQFWKAFRVSQQKDIKQIALYENTVDALLLDAWHPSQVGGTGQRIPIELLKEISFKLPWWLAGGVSAELIHELLPIIQPFGVDASSRLEISPGVKDLKKVSSLVEAVRSL